MDSLANSFFSCVTSRSRVCSSANIYRKQSHVYSAIHVFTFLVLLLKSYILVIARPVNIPRYGENLQECCIINPVLSLLMKHLVIGQHQKAPNFSAFHWLLLGSLVSTGQHFVTTKVVHLPKRTETSLITEADLITESDQAVQAVHSCNKLVTFSDLNVT